MNTIKGDCCMTERLADVIKYRQIPACFIIFYATFKSYGKIHLYLKTLLFIANPRITASSG